MKPIIRALAIAVLCVATATAMLSVAVATSSAAATDQITERVVNLPGDQGKPYLTVFVEGGDQTARQLEAWFASDAELREMKAHTHFHIIDARSVMFRERYAASTPRTPCVRLQSSDGRVVAEITDVRNATGIAKYLKRKLAELWRCDRDGCRPQPTPQVDVTPADDPTPQPLDVPSYTPVPEPDQSIPWLALAIVGLVGGGAGVCVAYRQQYYS